MFKPQTFELQTLHAYLFDIHRGTHIVLPDLGVNAQMSNMKDQERCLLLNLWLFQGQQHLEEEAENRMRQPYWRNDNSWQSQLIRKKEP